MAFISSGCPPTPVFLPVTLPAEQRVSRSAQRAASLIAQACAKSLTAKDRPRTRGRRPSSCLQSSRLSCWLSWPAAPRSRPFETSARAALHSSVPLAAHGHHTRAPRASEWISALRPIHGLRSAANPSLRQAHKLHIVRSAPACCLPHLSLGPHLGSWQTKKKRLQKFVLVSFPNPLPGEQVVTWKV